MKDIKKIISGVRKAVKGKEITWHKNLNIFQILIGTVLSQRTKDANTEKAAKQLFSKYKTPNQIARANLKDIERLIKPSGFYKAKARYIKRIAQIIVKKYKGKVPKDREKLIELPGVGAKTSGIVLVYGFGIPAGIPVDVHVHRISNRIGLVKTKRPEETEAKLMEIVPKEHWIEFNTLFVLFGQNICTARNPKCPICPIKSYCDYYKNHIQKLN